MADVVLQYKKIAVKGSDGMPLSTGQVLLRTEEMVCTLTPFPASGLSFAEMYHHFGEALRAHPEARAVLERIDREGLSPNVLDEAFTKLLRHDTAAAVSALSYTPAPPVKKEKPLPLPPVLTVGHDSIANAFGELVYCAMRMPRHEIECPACGHWERVGRVGEPEGQFFCRICAFRVEMQETGDARWGQVRVKDLLAGGLSGAPAPVRFFFPREWNAGRVWIQYKDLQQMYDTYLQEKSTS